MIVSCILCTSRKFDSFFYNCIGHTVESNSVGALGFVFYVVTSNVVCWLCNSSNQQCSTLFIQVIPDAFALLAFLSDSGLMAAYGACVVPYHFIKQYIYNLVSTLVFFIGDVRVRVKSRIRDMVQQGGLGSVSRVGRVSSRPQALSIPLGVIVLPGVGVPQCLSPLRVKEADGNCLGSGTSGPTWAAGQRRT